MIGLTLAARRLAVTLLLLLTAMPGLAAEQIWPRVCEGMSLHGEAQPQVQKWRDYYSSHPRRVRSLLAPSEPWLWHIVRAIDERGFPMEIALLPVIESNYNPNARSPGGAEGLWQFVGVTARNHGLRETDWYDGRRDALASTDAALDYLANLHDLFDNWLLALAAYNVGENRLIAEQRKQLAAGLPRNFWKMPLPEETRGHVPRLLGLALAEERREIDRIEQQRREPPVPGRLCDDPAREREHDSWALDHAHRFEALRWEVLDQEDAGVLKLHHEQGGVPARGIGGDSQADLVVGVAERTRVHVDVDVDGRLSLLRSQAAWRVGILERKILDVLRPDAQPRRRPRTTFSGI